MKKRANLLLRSILFVSFLLFLSVSSVFSQTFLLGPPMGVSSGSSTPKIKIFFKSSEALMLNWNKNLTSGYFLKIGSSTGNYDKGSLAASGLSGNFNPGLSTGRYYAIITNSSKQNLSSISSDQAANPASINYSNEIEFIIESANASKATAPTGIIDNSTPVFQWNSVPGVKSYWLIVSSTPFSIVTGANGEVSIEGANVVWNYLTSSLSVQYGSPNSNSPLSSAAPPLIANTQYYYTILNVYDENDITYTSAVFGGVESFTYKAVMVIEPPKLVSPANNSSFYAAEKINFKWDPVKNANGYSIYLYQRMSSFAGNKQEIDIPVWNSNTTNTSIEFSARTTITKGKYVWYVVPRDNQGSGNKSETFFFDYTIELGNFNARVKSASDGSDIVGFELYATSTGSGITPANPFISINSASYTDSLVVGSYQFRAKKTGYYDSTVVAEIKPKSQVNFVISLRPYASKISGKVVDQVGISVGTAIIRFQNLLSGDVKTFNSTLDGSFNFSIPRGSYQVQASKPGYLATKTITITIESDQFIFQNPFVLKQDQASISGKILNDDNQPVQLASIFVKQGNVVQQTSSNTGSFAFNLSSGQWILEVKKDGFISPPPVIYNLVEGDNIQNQTVIIIPRSNQVTGNVYKLTTSGTSVASVPFENAIIKASPSSGSVVTAVANSSGQYTLSLKGGSWTITASADNYTSSDPIQLNLSVAQTVSGINFNLKPNQCTISGVVQSAGGTAIADATVSSSTGESTISLSNGAYTLSVPATSLNISAKKGGFISPDPVALSPTPGKNITNVNFKLVQNAGTISGKVVSQQEPVNEAVIKAVSGTVTAQQLSNQFGEYNFDLQPGVWVISASKTGFISSATKSVTIGGGQSSNANDFELTRNVAKIEGLISGNAELVSGAQIVITDLKDVNSNFTTLSNSNGFYSIFIEAGKSYSIKVSKEGFTSSTQNTALLAAGSSLTLNYTLQITPTTISGRVTNSAQQVLSGVKLYIYNNGTNALIDSLLNKDDGTFNVGLPSVQVKIVAKKGGYVVENTIVTLQPGQNLTNLNFSLKENFGQISGSVKDAANAGIGGATINLQSSVGGVAVSSNNDGSFLIPQIIGGNYKVVISKTGYADFVSTNYQILDGQSKILNTQLSLLNGKISGTVTTAAGGAVAQTTIFAKNSLNKIFTAESDQDGKFELANMAVDTYTLSASKVGYTSLLNPKVTLTVTNLSATVNINDLSLNSGKVSGIVKDASGSPIPDVLVKVSGSLGSGSAVTNSSGVYVVEGLTPGTYTVTLIKTGFSSEVKSIAISGDVKSDLAMKKNQSKISGVVLNQNGKALSFIVDVRAISSGGNLYTAKTDNAGNYVIDGIEDNATYKLLTDLFKQGFQNDSTTVTIPAGTAALQKNLVITESNSAIYGNVGVGGALIKITNNAKQVNYSVVSNIDGSYFVGYLSNAAHTVTPTKQGYSFSPQSQNVTLNFKDSIKTNFTSSSSVGNLKVVVKDQDSKSLENALVTIVSTDTTVVRSATTTTGGEVSFQSIPANKTYIITTSLTGYSIVGGSTTKAVAQNANEVVNIAMSKATAKISGRVTRNSNGSRVALANTSIKLTYGQTGQTITVTSDANGNYLFDNLVAGVNLKITAVSSGFTSEVLSLTELKAGESKTGLDLNLTQSVVKVAGRIVFKGSGLKNVNVTATSINTQSTLTDDAGNFSFIDLPVKSGATDTTYYEIKIDQKNLPSVSQIVRIPSSQIGQSINLNPFVLPSGKITLRITDGTTALSNVRVDVTKTDGNIISAITTSTGVFESEDKLTKGTYRLSLSKTNYLQPDEKSIRVELLSDTSTVTKNIELPFTHIPVTEIYPDKETIIKVYYTKKSLQVQGALEYQLKSSDKTISIPLVKTDTTYQATLPALNTLEEVSYAISIKDIASGTIYSTSEFSVNPIAKGILSAVSITPDLNNVSVRMGDVFGTELILRDGINANLNDQFKGASKKGTIKWEADDKTALELSFPTQGDSTVINIKPLKVGALKFKVTAKLSVMSITQSFLVNSYNPVIKSITVESQIKRLSNKSKGLQFDLSISDSSKKPVLLGNNLVWTLDPAEAGTISRTGFYKPADSTYIGNLIITATDQVSQKKGSTELTVYASVNPSQSYSLNNRKGMVFSIPKGGVTFPVEIFISKSQFGPSKKNYSPLDKDITFTVSDKLYNLRYVSDVALPGDSLQKAASIQLPLDPTFRFSEGVNQIGVYNPLKKKWTVYNTLSGASSVSSNAVYAFGEYSILNTNAPLGLKYVSVLPSPFSPEVSPLKIAYFLSTSVPPASVTIKIYNIRGELVRTILENDFQYPGKYGGRTGIKEIEWDGMTNEGFIARNGRYLINISVKDHTGEKNEIIQCVLIK